MLDGCIAENWRKFSQKFDLFLRASNLSTKPEETKIAAFLNLIGDDGLELHNSFTYEKDEDKTLESLKKKFEEYCSPTANVIFERYKFNSIVQQENQPFDSFLTELRKAVKTTGYKDQDDMIRDRIVMGIWEHSTQERLLREGKLTLNKAIDLCRATEVSKSQAKVLQNESHINSLRKRGNGQGTRDNENKKVLCKYCGYKHMKNIKCPAFGKTCANCQGKNHFAAVCRSKCKQKEKKKVHEVESKNDDAESGSDSQEFYVDSVKQVEGVTEKTVWTQKVVIEDKVEVNFKLDTGAEVSVLPMQILRKHKLNERIKPTNISLVSYGSDNFQLKALGEVNLNCKIGNREVCLNFVVVDVKGQSPLLGLPACVNLRLIKRVASCSVVFKSLSDVINKFRLAFDGLGSLPKEHKISLKSDAVPYIQSPRRVPRALHDRLKLKLHQLESQGIIQQLDGPSEWLNPLVIVEKANGDLRLCLDPKYLNNAIQREHFLIPTAEEIALKLCNKEYFTVLDMKDGYFQIKLDEESSNYTAFGTPFGRYKFLRLPFGIKSAPEVFQKRNYEIFGDLDGVGLYFDDLIITGKDEKEHDANLKTVLERALKYNVKFNSSKIQFKSKSVKFMGQIYSKKGVEPNKNYVKAILDLPSPKNKSELLRILGMAKYLGRFVPNMSKVSAPLRDLTRQEVSWDWNKSHDQSLTQLKHLLASAPILVFF